MNALLIHRFLRLHDMKPLELPAGALQEIALCPADSTPLSVVATLVGKAGAQQVRVGWCDFCGYRAFMDRPTDAWLGHFYASQFDEARVGKGKIERRVAGAADSDTVLALLALGLSPSAPIVDIGCGYGEKLAVLKEKGFHNLRGIERSAHRAAVARRAFVGEVLEAFFCDASVEQELQKRPPGVLLAHHVLEHTSDPRAFLSAAASAQREGGFCIIAVPNARREGAISQLLFLPHLHSFSAATLVFLAARAGYAVVSLRETAERNLVAVLRRDSSTRENNETIGVNVAHAILKLRYGLGLQKQYIRRRRRLWWYRKGDCGGQTFLFSNKLLDASYDMTFARWRAHCAPRAVSRRARSFGILSAEVETPRQRVTKPDTSPIELQFEGPITILYK